MDHQDDFMFLDADEMALALAVGEEIAEEEVYLRRLHKQQLTEKEADFIDLDNEEGFDGM